MTTVTTESGRTREVPDKLMMANIVGLDPDGRFVVDNFGALTKGEPFLFALTLCCDASDKGVEDGVVCRGCYSDNDTGAYLFPVDGQFPELDPIVRDKP